MRQPLVILIAAAFACVGALDLAAGRWRIGIAILLLSVVNYLFMAPN